MTVSKNQTVMINHQIWLDLATFYGTNPIYGTDHINKSHHLLQFIDTVAPVSEFSHHLPMIRHQYALPQVLWPPKGQKSRRPSTAENRRRKAPAFPAFPAFSREKAPAKKARK